MLDSLKRFLKRPAAWGAVIVAYFGMFAGFGFYVNERNNQHDDLCEVVRNVHTNAKFRYRTELDRLDQSKKFLADPASKDNIALYRRVKSTLPVVKQTVEVARRGAVSTRVPPSCRI
jgi:hypothetical protein